MQRRFVLTACAIKKSSPKELIAFRMTGPQAAVHEGGFLNDLSQRGLAGLAASCPHQGFELVYRSAPRGR